MGLFDIFRGRQQQEKKGPPYPQRKEDKTYLILKDIAKKLGRRDWLENNVIRTYPATLISSTKSIEFTRR